MGLTTSDGNCGCSSNTGGTTPGNEFAQNNVGRRINAGFIYLPATPSNMYEGAVEIAVAEKLQAQGLTITEIETPVRINVIVFVNNQAYKKHKLFFLAGKGKYGNGAGDTFLSATMVEIFDTQDLTLADFPDNPFTITIDLGEVPDGDYLSAANSGDRDLSDSSKTYLFKYTRNGKTYLLSFDGDAGYYGGTYPDLLNYGNLNPVTDSDATPSVTRTDQLENTGEDGTSKFATETELNGLTLVVNQSAAEMYLKNAEGQNLATISLAFLNNEGTTFFYNATTEKLELKNDAGEILSEVPVSAFVSGLIHSVEFNGAAPYLLEFKDSAGNVVDSVTLALSNVQGLTAALAGKANTNGSNATGTWGINVAGYADRILTSSSGTSKFHWQDGGAAPIFLWGANDISDTYVFTPASLTVGNSINWGGRPVDWTPAGVDSVLMNTVIGQDITGTARKYTSTSFKTWLAIAMTDVSGLVTALANITTALAGKANTDGSNASGTWANIVAGNSNGLGGYLYTDVAVNAANVGNFLIRRANNLDWVVASPYVITQALGVTAKANDTEVLHKLGDEVKDGGLGIRAAAGVGNAYIQVLSSPTSSFPLVQLIDSPRGGKDWNIENGRTSGRLGFYSTTSADAIYMDQDGSFKATYLKTVNGSGLGWDGTSSKVLVAASGGTLLFYSNLDNGDAMRIIPNNNVGIGYTVPQYRLDVNGGQRIGSGGVNAGNTALVIKNDAGSGKQWSLSSGIANFTESSFAIINATDGVTAFTITPNGKVGIGTNLASKMLSVAGTGEFTDQLTIPAGTADTSAVNLGQLNSRIISATATYDFPQIDSGTVKFFTINVAGAAIGDNVLVNSALYPEGIIFTGHIFTSGVVTVRATNTTPNTNINIPEQTFNIRIIK